MECCCSAGFRNPDEFLSRAGKSGKLRPRGQEVGAGGSWLLDLPLGVKIPVQPGTKLLFARRKLGEKLHQPSPQFDLRDPYSRNLCTEYNSLHDPHLREFHNRKNNLRNLKKRGLVTEDGDVVCTLKEFNEYRQYLTRLKLEKKQAKRREEDELLREISNLKKSIHRLQMARDKFQPGPVDYIAGSKIRPTMLHKPAGPSPSCYNLLSGQCRRNVALMERGLQGDSWSTGRAMKLPEKSPKPALGREGSKLPRIIQTTSASTTNSKLPRSIRTASDPTANSRVPRIIQTTSASTTNSKLPRSIRTASDPKTNSRVPRSIQAPVKGKGKKGENK
ncbi:uncharacterized protein LOC107308840 [Coturnix japonica]|uniref:uncharacterized protein LOC107308840 n=1 Tax=Coturnix japonica TaxID=93934 RepID=UPI00077786B7|nr:uncharacterized protein LOC107308840 [Coturnix japonica]